MECQRSNVSACEKDDEGAFVWEVVEGERLGCILWLAERCAYGGGEGGDGLRASVAGGGEGGGGENYLDSAADDLEDIHVDAVGGGGLCCDVERGGLWVECDAGGGEGGGELGDGETEGGDAPHGGGCVVQNNLLFPHVVYLSFPIFHFPCITTPQCSTPPSRVFPLLPRHTTARASGSPSCMRGGTTGSSTHSSTAHSQSSGSRASRTRTLSSRPSQAATSFLWRARSESW